MGGGSEEITRDAFDLVLLDILMPRSNGYSILKQLRKKLDSKSKIAYVTILPKQDVNMEGVDGFIQKPFNTEDFITEIKRILSKK